MLRARGGDVPVWRRNIGLVAAALTTAIVGAACGVIQMDAAPSSGISSVTDYSTPGGNPWGTAFDAAGRVWVALPGCDPSPKCSTSTPPGKLALFDQNTKSWATTVSLP